MVALDTPSGPAWMWSVATYGSGATIAAAGALALLAFTPHWVRQSPAEDRGRYVRQSILDRGSVAVSELASGLGLAEEPVQEAVVDLVAVDRRARGRRTRGRASLPPSAPPAMSLPPLVQSSQARTSLETAPRPGYLRDR